VDVSVVTLVKASGILLGKGLQICDPVVDIQGEAYMDMVGDTRFVELPGTRTHELPPLLVRTAPSVRRLDRVVDMAAEIIESDDMIPMMAVEDPGIEAELERRRMDLALNLVDQYLGFVRHWQWGESVLEWIRQCEMTFEMRADLRVLLRHDIWPHAGRCSFVRLLRDKAVPTEGIALEKAVGMRLTFRQPPPIGCFSNQFLFYLNDSVATTAFQTWASRSPEPVSALPPERFTFEVVDMSVQ
jgi:hypothetical protein